MVRRRVVGVVTGQQVGGGSTRRKDATAQGNALRSRRTIELQEDFIRLLGKICVVVLFTSGL
jgi:glutamate dehydrogenase/leucine dehydrogenase